jgi:hypothetical protein
MRYKGGVISATPPTTSTTSAVGVWTLAQQLQAQGAGNWPTILSDQYFKYVTMLLHGDGTNGAQNNTFLDSSTNNFTITRNGNTTQGSFSPYGANWSNYFDGSSYITTPSNAAFGTGTGNFTVEAWVFITQLRSSNGENNIIGGGAVNSWLLGFFGSSVYLASTNFGYTVQISYTLPLNQWVHIAAVRNGNTATIYVNGTSIGSGSYTTNCPTGYGVVGGDGANGTARCMYGYISNARFNNTALYSSNFTPSTTPLTAVSGTQLLTCQSNRFIDNSTNAFAITVNGTPSVQRFSPFSPSAAYSTSTIGGSMYDDGTGDYLYVPSINVSGNWTVEGWFYFTTFAGGSVHIVSANNGGSGTPAWIGGQNSSSIGTYLTSWISSGVPFPRNQWCHIATVNNAGTVTIYLNGTSIVSASGYSGYSYSGELIIGSYFNRQGGYYSNVRFSTVARYTGAFTPPTTPFTNDASTYLLTNFTNGGIFDNAMMNNLETVGNAQISTGVVKFGTGSMAFDGTTTYLKSNSATTNLYAFGTGDFTIECWLYMTNTSGIQCIYESRPSGAEGAYILFYANSGTPTLYVNGGNVLAASSALSTNTWYHIALCRGGGSTRIFINGTQSGSTYSDTNSYLNGANRPYIGIDNSANSTYALRGYIDDLRITKGYARYTSNFTPPTAAFPNQ